MLAHPARGFRSADPRGPFHFVGLSDLHQQVHRTGELADQLEPLRPRRGLIVQHGQRPGQKLAALVQLRGRHGLLFHVDVRGVQLRRGLGARRPDDRGLRALGDRQRELLAVAQSVPHRPPDLAGWLAAALAGGDQLGLRVMDRDPRGHEVPAHGPRLSEEHAVTLARCGARDLGHRVP